jgi:hypothetical protein
MVTETIIFPHTRQKEHAILFLNSENEMTKLFWQKAAEAHVSTVANGLNLFLIFCTLCIYQLFGINGYR